MEVACQNKQNDQQILIQQPMVSLAVDRFDRIIALSQNWSEVAMEGHAQVALAPKKLVTKPLGFFIRGDDTRLYTEASLKLCRLRNETLYRHYRCDTPSHKRFMKLELVPLPNKAVQMNHFLLEMEPFANPVNIDDVAEQSHSATGIFKYVRCSMCNALKAVGSQQWVDPDKLSAEAASDVKVIHSVCPNCKAKAWQAR